jgi:hypothetical protein
MEKQSHTENALLHQSHHKKKEWQDLHVELLKMNMLKCFHSEQSSFCAYKSSSVKPEPNTAAASTVFSGWARNADSDL